LLQLAIFNFGSKNIPSHFFLAITSTLTYIIRWHYFKFPQQVVISHLVVYVVYKPAVRPFPALLVGYMLSYLGLYETTAVTILFPIEYKRI
jgi:hypothetical protein